MSFRGGVLRLVVLAIPYLGYWSFLAWEAKEDAKTAEALRQQAMAAGNLDLESEWFYAKEAADRAFEQSVFWGAYVPLAVLVGAGIIFWIYRGFKSKP